MLSLGERVRAIQLATGVDEKANLLRQHECPVLRDLVKVLHDDGVEFELAKGPYPYTESTDREDHTDLMSEWRRFKRIFIRGNYPGLKQTTRELNFRKLLGCLDATERQLAIEIKDKSITGIPREAVAIAYPGLLPNPK